MRRQDCRTAVVIALWLGVPASAADLQGLERAVRAASDERARLVEERARKMESAALLADEISRQKGDASGARADPRLETALKRFDRIALDLDASDRKIAAQDQAIAALRRKFDDAAGLEAARLSGPLRADPITQVAHELDTIEQARRRVSTLGESEPAFRPVLDVAVSPGDGTVELAQKRLLVESERERVMKGIAETDAEVNVLDARILVKRRLSAELESATRVAGSELALLRRESENVIEALRDLSVQRDALLRHRVDLAAALTHLELRLEELRSALRSMGAPKEESR